MANLKVTCAGTDGYELVLKGPAGVEDLARSSNAPLVVALDEGEYVLWRTMIGAPETRWTVKLSSAVYVNKPEPPKNSESRAFPQRGFHTGPRFIKVG